MTKDGMNQSVVSQIRIIRAIAFAEIIFAVIIVIAQTVAIGASYEYATRSLTGVWTSWFFFMAAGLVLFWSSRCTFNGLLTVLVLQIIAATMAIPLFTACCILIGVYDFHWSPQKESENALLGSSITILATNLIMIFASIIQMILCGYNAYNCFSLAYGGDKSTYGRRSARSSLSANHVEEGDVGNEAEAKPRSAGTEELNLLPDDTNIMKSCGVAGLFLALLIFSCQIAMFALAASNGISIGIGVWGALYYAAVGLVTFYAGWKPSAQSTVAVFVLQIVQFILSIPLIGIAYYIVAVFGSCVQMRPQAECGEGDHLGAGLAVSIMGGTMALSGMVQGLVSLILILVCSQAVCGVKCMISGATVYPSS